MGAAVLDDMAPTKRLRYLLLPWAPGWLKGHIETTLVSISCIQHMRDCGYCVGVVRGHRLLQRLTLTSNGLP